MAPFKVGPDFIDPGYHALATGRPGRNLDPWLTSEELIEPLLVHGSRTPDVADVSVIEGVMGLFDGRLGTDGFASTAHIARLTNSPVVLVADISSASRSLAASLHGLRTFDDSITVAGVILNKSGSQRHFGEVARNCERIGLPVFGHLPRDAGISVPSRHLGLVPAAERDSAQATLDHLAASIEHHLDLDALLDLARSAPEIDAAPWSPRKAIERETIDLVATGDRGTHHQTRIAVAGGRAFTFRYAETEELMRASGLEPVIFDPIRDAHLPQDVHGIYLGGGFPEVHATALASNTSLLGELKSAAQAGMPIVAECAGMLYLLETLQGRPFADVLPATAAMGPRLTLGYRTAIAPQDTLIARAGETVRGHEFHRTQTEPGVGEHAAWELSADDKAWAEGFSLTFARGLPNIHASYLHTHWAGFSQLAARFAQACHDFAAHGRWQRPTVATTAEPGTSGPTANDTTAASGLLFHGDNEIDADLEDFAVNVRSAAPPAWLRAILTDELATLGSYPSTTSATDALAGHHGVRPDQVLVTNGASEGFTLLARALADRTWCIVHPQFTEPDAAARAAGIAPSYAFSLADIPTDADVIMIGNPTNPTGELHEATTLRSLLRPRRVLIVDEAFMDVAGDHESLIAADDMAGIVVVRSVTKTWSLAGVRAGYLVGDTNVLTGCARHQPHWSVNSLALAALCATTTPAAKKEAAAWYADVALRRAHLMNGLRALGLRARESHASFVLVQVGFGVREALRAKGFAVRRCDTFPGLDASWVRIAVREPAITDALLRALSEVLHA